MTSIAIPAPVKTAPSVLGCDRFLLAGEATNQKKGHGCVKIDTPWPFSILILRDARAPKRRAILKPFCDAIWGPGQASNPRQSRESQPFVRLPPLYSPFSSIVTPYKEHAGATFCGRSPPRGSAFPRPPSPPCPKSWPAWSCGIVRCCCGSGSFPGPPLMRGWRPLRIAGFFWKFSVGIREDFPAL